MVPSFLPSPILASLLAALPAATLAALAGTTLQPQAGLLVIVGISAPADWEPPLPFGPAHRLVSLHDGAELTLVALQEVYNRHAHLLPAGHRVENGYRFVRLTTSLPWDTLGYGAAIFTALFSAGVSAGFFSGYTTDSLLIRDSDWPKAETALQALFAAAAALAGF